MTTDVLIDQNVKAVNIQNICGVTRYSIIYSDTPIVRAIVAAMYPEVVVIEDLEGNTYNIDNKTLFNIPDEYLDYHTYSLIVIGHLYDPNNRLSHNVIFSESYIDYDYGLGRYNDNYENYKYLVKLETKHYQDITVYEDENNYDFLRNCCRTCANSRVVNNKLVCAKINIASKLNKRYTCINPGLNPIVDPNGICSWYEEDLNKCYVPPPPPVCPPPHPHYPCPPYPKPPTVIKHIVDKVNDMSEDISELKNEQDEHCMIIDISNQRIISSDGN